MPFLCCTQSSRSPAHSIGGHSFSTPKDPFAFLSTFYTVVLIDDSGSMTDSRWREVEAVLYSITPICTAHDTDDIDLYFLNHHSGSGSGGDPSGASHAGTGYNYATPNRSNASFKCVYPYAITPTGRRLADILNPYLRHYECCVRAAGGDAWATDVKLVNLIVITDG